MTAVRVMLVDDHAVVRAGLRGLLAAQPDLDVVAEAGDVAAAVARFAEARPDLAVIDLTLPGGGGLALTEKLTAGDAPPRVLILTMHDDPAYVRAALAAGATGYAVKTVREADLLAGVRMVARGQVFVDLDHPARTAQVLAGLTGRAPAGAAVRLSEREVEVLRLLGKGYTNQAAAEHLDISPKTVATYRARVGDKLGLRSTADFVKYAADNGLTDTMG